MGMVDDIVAKVADPYERKARLYPALLALLPVVVTVTLLYEAEASALKVGITIAVSCGGLYLMTNVCRQCGKRLEERLYQRWGGPPTVQLLRHSDDRIEGPTKKRYHAFLASKTNLPFPNAQQEKEHPGEADDIYRSGIRWLLNHTRPDDNKKFELLFRENIAYGFLRNGLGIKPAGVTICLACIVWTLVKQHVIRSTRPFLDPGGLGELPNPASVSLIIAAVMFCVWWIFFTKGTVRTAAFTYAEMLLRACDSL